MSAEADAMALFRAPVSDAIQQIVALLELFISL